VVSAAAISRTGVFGSMFNPPHVAHVVLCQEALWQLGLQRVVLVPTGRPPHRAAPAQSAELRLRLVQAAVTGTPGLSVSRVEVDRDGPSYMVDTLRELADRYPGTQLVLLIGEDQLARLGSWHEAALIPRLARLGVARRPGAQIAGAERAAVEWIDMPCLEISSSEIRERVAAGRPIRHLVPEGVRAIIEAEGLYR
jgi:nicotinate-nucleotide adenylyltransferase